ncbi:MAG: hypothetical protein SCK28_03815 [Bacillota bacterium]|nr:hypothetical protein [Bacillota bacterium]
MWPKASDIDSKWLSCSFLIFIAIFALKLLTSVLERKCHVTKDQLVALREMEAWFEQNKKKKCPLREVAVHLISIFQQVNEGTDYQEAIERLMAKAELLQHLDINKGSISLIAGAPSRKKSYCCIYY